MKIVLSPAKSLDFKSTIPTSQFSQPIFQAEAERINKLLKKKTASGLSKLMHISDALATLNYERNQSWSLPFDPQNSRPAVFTFSGDVYRGLDAFSMSDAAIAFAQDHLLILSGLYGLLKPLDLMQAYRLEMGTKMPVGSHKNLYEFWKQKITNQLNEELSEDEILINLASKEYFKAIDTKVLKATVITPVFKEFKNGQYKTIGTFAKPARGMMSRYLIDIQGVTLNHIKAFDKAGYGFSEELSSETELVFTR